MSHLLNVYSFRSRNGKAKSIEEIVRYWDDIGFLQGLDYEMKKKVGAAIEVAAQILVMEGEFNDFYSRMLNEEQDYDYYQTATIPIVRRVVTGFPEAHKYVPEILGMIKGEYASNLFKSMMEGDESAIEYYFNYKLPRLSKYWRERKKQTYKEFKQELYDKHVEKYAANGMAPRRTIDDYPCIDWEAEFVAVTAEIIEIELRKRTENGTNIL